MKRSCILVVMMVLVMLSFVTSVNAAVIVDDLIPGVAPAERIVSDFYCKWDSGFGVDPFSSTPYVAVTTAANNPNNLKYGAAAGETFSKMTVSFANIYESCAFDLYDANGTQVTTWTKTLYSTSPSGALKWYIIEALPSAGYDFRELFIKVWGTAGYAALGTVKLETVAVPEPATIGMLCIGGLAMLRRRK